MSSGRVLRRCREAEEKRKNKAEEKADDAVEAAQETVERVVDEEVDQQLETVSAESLDMKEDTAQDIGIIMLAKVVVVSGSCAREIQASITSAPTPRVLVFARMPVGTDVVRVLLVQCKYAVETLLVSTLAAAAEVLQWEVHRSCGPTHG